MPARPIEATIVGRGATNPAPVPRAAYGLDAASPRRGAGDEPSGAAGNPRAHGRWALVRNGPMLVALLDQGTVSFGNFVTNVLLARSLPADQYGVFALFLDAILFLNSLQAALLIYPLTVRCPTLTETELKRYSGACVLLTLALAIPMSLALALYGAVIGAGSVVAWAVLGQTFWQCQETLRRTLLARRSYGRAIVGDCISYLGQAAVLEMLILGNRVDVSRAFMAMALTSAAAAAVQGLQIGARPVGWSALMRLGRQFWLIGRWVMTANLTNVITSVCCSYTLARSHGDAAMGQYAAVSNLLRIANPLFITLATMIVPAVSAASPRGDSALSLVRAWRVARHYGLRGAALLTPYWATLFFAPGAAIALLYPHRLEYRDLQADLRIFVFISILNLINAVMASMFNGLRRNRRAMMAQIVGAAACVAVAIPLTVRFGLVGLLVGSLITNAAIAASLIQLYRMLARELRDKAESD
jgi:O-antigen/teichoic acid export membrane protein